MTHTGTLNPNALLVFCLLILPTSAAGQVAKNNWRDPSPHQGHFASVNGVTLHYLDWGGNGEALMFLAGLGNTPHIFDDLAPRFTRCFHVIGFTRRGFGLSNKPATGYDIASRVADLLGLLDYLHITRVNLVGHSIAGDELIEFAARHPDRVGSLVFLDATYDHSTMPVAAANAISDAASRSFDSVRAMSSLDNFIVYQKHLLRHAWAQPWEADIRDAYSVRANNNVEPRNSADAIAAVRKGSREAHLDFAHIPARALTIVALSEPMESFDSKERAKHQLYADEITNWKSEQLRILCQNGANVRVVKMRRTDHYCFLQRPGPVTKEMMTFLNCHQSKSR